MTELHENGNRAAILLRALRYYREECEEPELHPHCPFAVTIEPGIRDCGEECLEMLQEHKVDPLFDELVVNELTFRRTRSTKFRRGPRSGVRPFDASEIRLQERSASVRDWATVSIFRELAERTAFPASTPDSDALVAGCLGELDRRGFDSDVLIRTLVASSLSAMLHIGLLLPADAQAALAVPSNWRLLILEDDSHKTREETWNAITAGVSRVIRWAHTAPIEDVVAWRAPMKSEFDALGEAPPVSEPTITAHLWLLDRFTRTYLSDWSSESLELEWRYIRGRATPPCPLTEMRERRVDAVQLAPLVADIVVGSPGRSVPLAQRFVFIALDLLKGGRRSEAAEIFRVAADVDPGQPSSYNNYGFCLLPDKPAEGLAALQKAAELGWVSSPLNIANRMWGLVVTGKFALALALAESFFEVNGPERGEPAWLWRFPAQPDQATIMDVPDVTRYIVELARHGAELAEDDVLVKLWTERVEAVAAAGGG